VGAVVVVVAAAAVGLQLASNSIAVNRPSTAYGPDLEPLATTAPEPNAQSVSLASGPRAPAANTQVDNRRRYVVQRGDSLESIAARNGLRPDTLASVNELDNPDLLQPGRELVVPLSDGTVHIVQPGETLRLITDRYHVDVASLITANDLPVPDHIPAGLRLFVPGASPPADRQRSNP